MLAQLEEIQSKALRELSGIGNAEDLESWRVRYLGKKSELIGVLRGLPRLPLEERKPAGAQANQVKAALEESCF